MASDIPTNWSSSYAMARALATYMDNPHAIRRAVLDSFSSAPEIHTIKRYRAEHLAPREPDEPFKAYEGYYPGDESKRAEAASEEFLRRIRAERRRSAEFSNPQWVRVA